MIKSYCHQDVETGIRLLKAAAADGYVRSSYALGLVLRDSQPEEATKYMKLAAGEGYLPALQELLPAREMKAKYGEPNADELRRHLDPICLNHLLGRHYVHSAELRELNTSHCWNPLCGRWAFKASVNANGAAVRLRRPWGLAFLRNGNGGAQPFGTGEDPARNDNTNHVGAQNDANNALPVADRNDTVGIAPVAAAAPAVASRNESTGASNDNRTVNGGPRAGPPDADTRVDTSGTSDESSPPQPGNQNTADGTSSDVRVSRMKMCSRCCRAKYCSKLCQVYDWRSGRHKMECQFL
jgi:MYND finger